MSETKPINFEPRIQHVEELRKSMGTHPSTNVELKTEFHRGVEGITVDLIDYPSRPYRSLYDIATATWTSGDQKIDKWPDASPVARHAVVKAVLDFKSLPNAMESISFTFGVQGCSRSAFDQIARARIGAVFGSMGWRDNDHSDVAFRIPEAVWKNDVVRDQFMETMLVAKSTYHDAVKDGQANWQNARAVMPIFAEHKFATAFNYMALRGFMSKRLKFCEQEDTVAVAWLMKKRITEKFPLLGDHLVPGCDTKGKCDYHEAESMAEAFGCLFAGCGRWPDPYPYASFNESCSDEKTIAKQLNIDIPDGETSRILIKHQGDYGLLYTQDRARFEGEG